MAAAKTEEKSMAFVIYANPQLLSYISILQNQDMSLIFLHIHSVFNVVFNYNDGIPIGLRCLCFMFFKIRLSTIGVLIIKTGMNV